MTSLLYVEATRFLQRRFLLLCDISTDRRAAQTLWRNPAHRGCVNVYGSTGSVRGVTFRPQDQDELGYTKEVVSSRPIVKHNR